MHSQSPSPPGPLAAFLSKTHRSLLQARGGLPTSATEHDLDAAALFMDLEGFTALAERFGRAGAQGAERLSELIDRYFGRATEAIERSGGDVLFFAGDGLLALWPSAAAGGLSDATWRAAACAHAIQHDLQGDAATQLALRASVGAGRLTLAEVHGGHDRWYLLAAGGPIRQVTQADQSAVPGEVTLTPHAWTLVAPRAEGQPTATGMMRLGGIASPPPRPPKGDAGRIPAAALRPCVPRVVVDRLEAGQSDWLAEFRTVTVLFVRLAEGDVSLDATQIEPIVALAVDALHRLGGSVYQLLADDKGVGLVAAFGLPPRATEQDAARASRAAVDIHAGLARLGSAPSIGVATGRVYCGVYGTADRRQYSLVGPTINRGARLMQAAGRGILCDASTARAGGTDGSVGFDDAGPLSLKGHAEPVDTFRPARRETPGPDAASATTGGMVGRTAERAALQHALDGLAVDRRGAVVIVEGEPGIGKSRLLTETVTDARARQIRVLTGAAEEIEDATAYYAWRPILRDILGVDAAGGGVPDPPARIAELFATRPDRALRAPLLNAVLPLGLPDSEITAGLNEESRAESTRRFLVELLRDHAAAAPTAVVIEDVHWLDVSSWALLAAAADQLDTVLFLATTRPLDPVPPDAAPLLAHGDTQRIGLRTLTVEETRALVCQALEVGEIPVAVVSLIQEKAAGNPLFSQELAYALRDFDVIDVRNGTCVLAGPDEDIRTALERALEGQGVPGTVQGIITTRLDRLPPPDQLAVKVASVIGQRFTFDTLLAVYPVDTDAAAVTASLRVLEQRHLVLPEGGAALGYRFRHAITQDVVYGSLAYAQRRDLHRRVAEWLERRPADERQQLYPVLAHHWRGADHLPNAAKYLTKAGAHAVDQYANAEAVRFLSEALAIEEQLEEDAGEGARGRRADQSLLLGKAHLGLSEYAADREHLERGLRLLGLGVPGGSVRLVAGILGEVVRQVRTRAWPSRYVGRRGDDRARLLRAAAAYEGLAETYYYTGEQTLTLYACLRTLNLAEAAGRSPELARGYATFGTILGYTSLSRPAVRYGRRAVETARAVGHLAALPYVYVIVGIERAGVGDWRWATELFEDAARVGGEVGDRRRWADAMGHLAVISVLHGRIGDAARQLEAVYDEAASARDLRYQVGALVSLVSVRLATDQLDDARAALREIEGAVAGGLQSEIEATRRHLASLWALCEARCGAWDEALPHIRDAARLIGASRPGDELYSGYLSVTAALDAAIAALEAGYLDEILPLTTPLVRNLAGRARLFPVARPALDRLRGTLAWIRGRRGRAAGLWRRSLQDAERRGMSFDASLARLETARHLEPPDQARAELLVTASSTFEAVGATFYRTWAERLLRNH